jgi:hypothetical protein
MTSFLPSGFAWLGSALWFAFIIWMLVDSYRTMGFSYWSFIILFFQPFGAIAYCIIYVLPALPVARTLNRMFMGNREVRELRAQIHNMDRPYHWAKLGDVYRNRRNWAEAAQAYDEALKREPNNEEARFGLGVARLRQQQWQAALDLLEPLVAAKPDYARGEAMLAIAQAWRGLGRAAEALAAYAFLLNSHSYVHAQYEYAALLLENGERDQAKAILQRLVEDGRHAVGFNRVHERRWGRRAAKLLKACPA